MTHIVVNGNSTQVLPQGEDVENAVHLDALSDVTITNLTTGEILKYNGGQWVNVTIDDLQGDITLIDGGAY